MEDLQIDVLEHFDGNFAHLIRLANIVQVQQNVFAQSHLLPVEDFDDRLPANTRLWQFYFTQAQEHDAGKSITAKTFRG